VSIIKGKSYMSDFEAKKAIIEVGARMYSKGFVAANDGNISCKVGPETFWTTCTGVSKGFMTQDMLVKMDMSGKILVGRRKPSSEVKMHMRVYEENPEVMAVTHAHPPKATAFAIAGISLDKAVLPEAVVQLGSVPIAKYATPGSEDVPNSIAPFCKGYNGVLLANHGALSWGSEIFEAFYRLESMEYYAQILMYTGNIIGKQNELSCGQVNELIGIREKLGIDAGGAPSCVNSANNMQDVLPGGMSQESSTLKGVTPLVKPEAAISCGCGSIEVQPSVEEARKTKEEIMREVVRRVTEEMR
jgi:Ribulose-5-phosphate 4-epimerase and related epimerases and aldolases